MKIHHYGRTGVVPNVLIAIALILCSGFHPAAGAQKTIQGKTVIQKQPTLQPTRTRKNPASTIQSTPVVTPAASAPFPEILSVNPGQATQGQTLNLMLSGRHLKPGMKITLGTGITADSPKIVNEAATMAAVQVSIAPSAPEGYRSVTVEYGNRSRPQNAGITVLSGYQPPGLRSVSPDQLFQGKEYTLTFTGVRLKQVTKIDSGPGITIHFPSRTRNSDNQITAAVTVAASAIPGKRMITLSDHKGPHRTHVAVTVKAAAPAVIPPVDPVRPITQSPVRPSTVVHPTDTMTPVDPVKPVTPAPVPPSPVVPPTHPTTPPAPVVPPSTVVTPVIPPPSGTPTAPPSFTPATTPPTPPRGRISLMLISPLRWYQGKEYELTLRGMNLAPEIMFDLGKDIVITDIQIQSASLAKMKIAVGKQARPGRRTLKYKQPKRGFWQPSPLSGLVIEKQIQPVVTLTPVPKFPPLDVHVPKSDIVLLTPEFGDVWIMENAWQDVGIPTSNDATCFTWEEKQVGASQWFELRILDRKGNIVITRKIQNTGLPENFYAPDVDFIMEIFSEFRPQAPASTAGLQVISGVYQPVQPASQVHLEAKPDFQLLTDSGTLTYPDDDKQYIIDNWQGIDCFWQIAGFKRFSSSVYSIKSGQVETSSADVEVAISEKWPLKLPAHSPTGLICSMANTMLDFAKVHDDMGQPVEAHNIFVGDTVRLSGQFTLDGCPWSVSYNGEWEFDSPAVGLMGAMYKRSGWLLNNVFVDWGDGFYDPVHVLPADPAHEVSVSNNDPMDNDARPGDDRIPPSGTVRMVMEHTYRYAQKFPVRVFVLPEDDVGMIDVICQANKSHKADTAPEMTQKGPGFLPDRHTALLADSGMIVSDAAKAVMPVKPRTELSAIPPGFEPVGSRAFLVYCEPKIIDVKADPAAVGDLHLISLNIVKFTGQDPVQIPLPRTQTKLPPRRQEKITLPKSSTDPHASPHAQTSNLSVTQTAPASQTMLEQTAATALDLRPETDARASACDEAFHATVRLEYFGKGRVYLVWKIDGFEFLKTFEDIGPSPIRTELDDNYQYTEPPRHGFHTINSPCLPLDVQNLAYKQYQLTVDAYVEGYETIPQVIDLGQLPDGKKLPGPEPDPYWEYVQRSAMPKTYLVEQSGDGIPCLFKFPVADGKFFKISNLSGRVTQKQGKYYGSGTLYFQLPDGSGGMETCFAEIHFTDWEVSDDDVVTQGSFDVQTPNVSLDNLPGMTATLSRVKGEAGGTVEAVMDIQVADTGIHMVGAESLPPGWPGATGSLIPEDGWYSEGNTMPLTAIYWSDFHIQSDDVRLDLSRLRGEYPVQSPPSSSSGIRNSTPQKHRSRTAKETASVFSQASSTPVFTQTPPQADMMIRPWAGIHLGHAALYPYLFDLADESIAVQGWNITDNGVAGHSEFKNFSYVMGDGKISFDNIVITAGNRDLDALYENVEVHIPWPGIVLKGGDARLNYVMDGENYALGFNFDTQNLSVTETYGNITMNTKVNSFDRMGSGWGISTDTRFDFTDGRNHFASVTLNDLFFNVYGVAHFKGDGNEAHHRDLPMNLSTAIGDTGIDLYGVTVDAVGDMTQKDRMFFTFTGDISFEALGTGAADVFYSIRKPAGMPFSGIGPSHSEITVSRNYPDACSDVHSLTHIEVHPRINLPDTTAVTADSSYQKPLLPSVFISQAYADSGVKDTFSGEIESTMFNVPLPGTARFRYGTYQGKPYWLTHVNLSSINVMIFSGVFLNSVNGGIAHGFSEEVFLNTPMTAVPDKPGTTVYSAGVTVGSADPGVYSLSGRMTVLPQEGVYRMDFTDVTLFNWKTGMKGGFRYANQVFAGKIYGSFNLYNGAITCDIPDADETRVGLHFSEDRWEIWAGRQNNPVTLNLLKTADVQGYCQFGYPSGYRVGGGIHLGTGKTCFLGAFAGEIYADTQMGMAITLDHLSAHASVSAGVGYWVPCSGSAIDGHIGQSVNLDVSAPPLSMKAYTDIDLPWCPGLPDSIHLEFSL